MKAVVYRGPYNVAVEDVPDPRIEAPTDAIVRITSAGLCGSDLHMYKGRTSMEPGRVVGHEPLGIVEGVGDGVQLIKKGDRVVMGFNVACGVCFNCLRGYPSACLTMNPRKPGAAYGYANMGPWQGAQAEYLQVPFADYNATKLPGQPNDQWEDDFLLLSDVFPTGYHATELAQVRPGNTVAVYGAGPVGLLSSYSAMLKGASEVYSIDRVPARLEKAEQIGAIPIDFSQNDPVERIFDMRRNNMALRGALLPGEEKLQGVQCGIDAVGYEAFDEENPSQQQPNQVLDDLINVVNATGSIGSIGEYVSQDPGGADPHARQGEYYLPYGQLWEKGLTLGTGQTPVKRYSEQLRDMVIDGRAKPSFIISQHVPLEDAPEAYKQFDRRAAGYTKVIFKP